MDKQKQIEEMTELMANWALRNNMCWHEGHAKALAETFVENDYAKIPENAVVLTEEELKEKIDCCDVFMIHHDDDGKKYIEYEKYEDFTNRLGKRIQQLKGLLKQERKETAEKFAEMLKEETYQAWIDDDHYDWIVTLDDIDEICKEITEGKNG